MRPTIHESEYAVLHLCEGDKYYQKYIRSLVASAFIGLRPRGYRLISGPGGKRDASLRNLFYHPAVASQWVQQNLARLRKAGYKVILTPIS